MKITEPQKIYSSKSVLGLEISKKKLLISEKKYTTIFDTETSKKETKWNFEEETLMKTKYHLTLDCYSNILKGNIVQIWKIDTNNFSKISEIKKKFNFTILNIESFFDQIVLFHKNGIIFLDEKLNEKKTFEQ